MPVTRQPRRPPVRRPPSPRSASRRNPSPRDGLGRPPAHPPHRWRGLRAFLICLLLTLTVLPPQLGAQAPAPAAGETRAGDGGDGEGIAPEAEMDLLSLLPTLFSDEYLEVEINLGSAMLRMLAEAARNSEDPSFAEVLAGLDDIQVRVAELDVEDEGPGLTERSARRELREATRKLERRGWQAMIRVRDEEEETYIYLLQSGERIRGLVVLFADDTEAGLVHIRGDIDPRQLGRVAAQLNLESLEDALEESLEDRLPDPDE